MRVLIVGAGEVGYHLAARLSQENQDVVLIESDPETAEHASQQLDVLTITGNGASLPVLQKAGVEDARVLLAVTSRDEVNLIACLAASRIGVEYTIARISSPEYYAKGSVLSREQLGIDLMINPERECAWESYQLLQSAAATDVAYFAEGRVQLLGLKVKEGARIAGRTLADLGQELAGFKTVTVAIVRDEVTQIPNGNSRIEAGDHVYLLAPTAEVPALPALAGYEDFKLRRVMIAGGSREGRFLAELLERQGVECTVLDSDRKRCLELAEALPKSLVLHGNATDAELLEMEGVGGVDGFVAATGNDETNLLASLLAKSAGARKGVSLIERFEYLPLIPKVGIDAAVSPRLSTVNAILRYIRRGRVVAVATLKGVQAEAIEFRVQPGAKIAGRAIAEAGLPPGSVVGTVLRGDEIITPRGATIIEAEDEVIVFALPDAIPEIEKLFA